ncbi:hypothetical protein [Ornithinibacillus scapharcae]|uniref:hypothetical protein n=1 Tax=Ornithinibacillus scapharcae TaxID=1147159 RepID=UPI000225B0D7|nr:hypothetical protein [Ornithinibacillus scapharcae]
MGPILVLILIILTVIIDVYWLDRDSKRWGWVKNWSNRNKAILLIGFIVISGLVYLGLSSKFL